MRQRTVHTTRNLAHIPTNYRSGQPKTMKTHRDKGLRSTTILGTVCLLLVLVTLALLIRPSLAQKIQHNLHYNKNTHPAWVIKELEDRLDKNYKFSLKGVKNGDFSDIRYTPSLLLINLKHPLPLNYTPELTKDYYTELRMPPFMQGNFKLLSEEVSTKFNETLYISSLARTYDEQVELYEEHPEVAQKPRSSEHEAGLAIDVLLFEHAGINFINHPAGRWVNENAWQHGFIIRYPRGKEDITGIEFEPWHLRYVGNPHAQIMVSEGLVLEEYIAKLDTMNLMEYGEYFVFAIEGEDFYLPKGAKQVHLSPDNTGRYVVWGKFHD